MQTTSIKYKPRAHFLPFHARREKFSVMVLHRRAGKTVACVADLIEKAIRCELPLPRYSYIAPYYKQAKKVAWAYLKMMAAPICEKVSESELSVTLVNGAVIQLFGADNPDALRGLYHDGVVLDEYGDQPPRIFGEIILPALLDRDGWAVFIGTPKGDNHFREAWDNSKGDPYWFRMMLKASESGVLSPIALQMARNAPGMDEDTYAQEFECDFNVANKGSFYGKMLHELEEQGHMGIFPYDPQRPILTGWDIGFTDDTSIWFVQMHGSDIWVVDFWSESGYSVDEVLDELAEKGYPYAPFYLPHDAANKSFQTGKSTRELMLARDAKSKLVPKLSVQDGIAAVRATLPKVYFNIANPKVKEGLAALKGYEREKDEVRDVFKKAPLHNWASHPADAFRYLALGLNPYNVKKDSKPLTSEKTETNNVMTLEALFKAREARTGSKRI